VPSAWPQLPDGESKPTPNFILMRACHGQSLDLQITNANKVPARPPGPLPPLPLRCTAAHVHTLHPQAMGIASAQVGGPCGCTHLGVVRGARPRWPQTEGSWLPSVSRVLLCNKTEGWLATLRLQERVAQPRPIHSTALQPWPHLGTYQQAKALLPSGYPLQVTAG
jgi:hypothetical protein